MLTACIQDRTKKTNSLNTGVVESGKIVQTVRPCTGLLLDGPSEGGTTDGILVDVVRSWDLFFAERLTLLHSSEEGIRKGRYNL